jgi:hypothetical protein
VAARGSFCRYSATQGCQIPDPIPKIRIAVHVYIIFEANAAKR